MSVTTQPAQDQAPPARGHVRLSVVRRRLRVGRARDLHLARRILPPAIGVAAVVALVLGIDPTAFVHAIGHFRYQLLAPIIVVSVAYYLLQGVRWQQLLRAIGVRLPMGDTILINVAGQATAVLPLGELTRAVLVTEATGTAFGAVVATVTVQELIYTMVLIVFAVPQLIGVPHALPGVVAALVLTALVFLSLSWCPAYRWLHTLVSRVPGVRRFLHDVEELHNDVVLLMRDRVTLTGAWISALQAACVITALWLVAGALAPGELSWEAAALVFAVSNVAGALSLIPGGIGAYEASVVGLLVGLGMNPGAAAAVAVIQRLADKGLATLFGFAGYAVAKRRLGISGIGTLPVRRELDRAA
jgi:glycosyltransferase 2 family protein